MVDRILSFCDRGVITRSKNSTLANVQNTDNVQVNYEDRSRRLLAVCKQTDASIEQVLANEPTRVPRPLSNDDGMMRKFTYADLAQTL